MAERNGNQKNKIDGTAKTIEDIIKDLSDKRIISSGCANASMMIWRSYRNDIHHMKPTVAKIDFKKLAQQILRHLSIIEKEIFDFKSNNVAIIPTNPKYWDIQNDGTASVFLRLD